MEAYGINDELIAITKELTEALRKSSTVDWGKKESIRAGMIRMMKRTRGVLWKIIRVIFYKKWRK